MIFDKITANIYKISCLRSIKVASKLLSYFRLTPKMYQNVILIHFFISPS